MIYLKGPYCECVTRTLRKCSREATARANDQWVCTQHWKLAAARKAQLQQQTT